MSAIIVAVRSGTSPYNLKQILASGQAGEVAARDDMGRTAIFWAAKFGFAELIRVLADAGCDPSTPDFSESGFAPIHVAVQARSVESVAALLDAGAPCSATAKGTAYARALAGE